MDSYSSYIINRVFTRNTIQEILNNGDCETVKSVFFYLNHMSNHGFKNRDIISSIYKYLEKEYQNEYYYKNTLLNKLLLGVHSPNTTTALTELNVGKSKADFVLINGHPVVYEIKTAMDTFNRLDFQLNDYYKAFSKVVLVTSEDKKNEAGMKLKGTPTGLYILTNKGTIRREKEPQDDTSKISTKVMFNILRKSEFQSILTNYYGSVPQVSDFNYYQCCYELFEKIPLDYLYTLFVKVLKKRNSLDLFNFNNIPYELKFLAYFSGLKNGDYKKLFAYLEAY